MYNNGERSGPAKKITIRQKTILGPLSYPPNPHTGPRLSQIPGGGSSRPLNPRMVILLYLLPLMASAARCSLYPNGFSALRRSLQVFVLSLAHFLHPSPQWLYFLLFSAFRRSRQVFVLSLAHSLHPPPPVIVPSLALRFQTFTPSFRLRSITSAFVMFVTWRRVGSWLGVHILQQIKLLHLLEELL